MPVPRRYKHRKFNWSVFWGLFASAISFILMAGFMMLAGAYFLGPYLN